jgi:hypothetical protein
VAPSGQPDRHDADQLPLFEAFACKPDPLGRQAVSAQTERTGSRLSLVPHGPISDSLGLADSRLQDSFALI